MEKRQYIAPETVSIQVNTKNCLLTASDMSNEVGVIQGDDVNDSEQVFSRQGGSSLWDDDDE